MSRATHLLVANPAAQSGRNASRIDRALRAFQKHRIPCEFMATRPDRQTISDVRAALLSGQFQCVVSMGGDGTLREVAQGLLESGLHTRVPLAMLPAGTANNHGRSFGLDLSDGALEKNVAIIAHARETLLDVGQLELFPESGETALQANFIDSVGFGIGARVITQRHAERRRFSEKNILSHFYRDLVVYTVATLQSLSSAQESDEFGVTIVADGQTRTQPQLTELLVKGTRVYAGRWIIDRTSKHDDGLFELITYIDNSRWVAKGLVDLFKNDKLDSLLDNSPLALPKPLRVARVEIEFQAREDHRLPAIQVDGDLFAPAKRAIVDVLPRVLRLIVP
ncbi:MAG TPA: diacylglycerol kinase family protein [Polyangium sp.]|nr:diacylglycerol kinase family protein [Polyangium sp.]